MKNILIVFSVLLISACANSHKPAPGWPDGPERQINAQPVVKPAK